MTRMGEADRRPRAAVRKGPPWAPILALAALFGAVAIAGVGAWALRQAGARRIALPSTSPGPLEPDSDLVGLTIPDFTLTDQSGESVSRDDVFAGHATIVDFVFTNCPFICPPMTRNMRALQQRLDGSGVRFVSFSVDPERDTPEALRAFAAKYGADLRSWTFLTGDLDAVQRILTQGLRLDAVTPLPQTPITLKDGSTMANRRHPSHFILVGPDARALALTIGTQPALHEAFAQRAERAAQAIRAAGDRASAAAP